MAYAFCTLLTSDSYLPGVLALGHALKHLHPKHGHPIPYKLVCLATPATLADRSLALAAEVWDFVVGVEPLEFDGQDAGLGLLGRHDLALVLTKLHVFRLTDFSKVIFLDADTLPLKPLSHLFALPYEFSASPDTGWPDCFNSGVMVLTPSEATFDGLRAVMNSSGTSGGSFDGGDQGVLNQWFSGEAGSGPRWNQLSFTYNVTPTAAYTYAPAYAHYGASISVVHFIGRAKPWHTIAYGAPHSATHAYNDPARPYHYDALVGRWWSVYNRWVAPRLRVDGGAVAAAPEKLQGGIAGKESGFVGLPLDGRDDLVPPSKRPAELEEPAPPPAPPSPPAREPSPEYQPQELQKGVPYFLPWDPATQDPPKTGAQMSGAFPTTDYSVDWARKAAGGPAGAGDWVPDVPERLRNGRGEREEAPAAVFPWENQARPPATRVFPGETRRTKPTTSKIGAPRPDLPPPAHHAAPASAPAPGVKQSFAQAMAGPSTNAWDADPAIQAYASRLTSPPPQHPAARQARNEGGGLGRGSRGGDSNRSREQSRDGGADGDDEESTGGDDSDDEAEDDGGEGDRVVMRFRRDGPGGGAGAAGGGAGGFSGSRPVTFAGASNNAASGGGGSSATGGGQHQQMQTQHHTSAEHHAMHSRAVQASTSVRNASTQYSPVGRTVPLPQQQSTDGVPTSAGFSTPPLDRAATSGENSVLHTPSSQQQQRAPVVPASNGGSSGASAAFNARFGFDSLGPKTGQQPSSQAKVKTAGRTWDREREVDAFRDQTRRFLGAH